MASALISRPHGQIRVLRGLLEWGRELEEAGGRASNNPADVMVAVFPGGDIMRLPRGTTAGHIIASQVPLLV